MNVASLPSFAHLPERLLPSNRDPVSDQPITVTVAREVLPDNAEAFEDWAAGIQSCSADYPGHLGSSLLRPGKDDHEYHIVYRFTDAATLHGWEHSRERAQWLDKLEEMIESERYAQVTGLESWFNLPEKASSTPARWKMVVVTSLVIFSLQIVIQALFLPTLLGWHLVPRVAVMTVAMTLLMTYLVMPRVTAALRGWLYPKPERHQLIKVADPDTDTMRALRAEGHRRLQMGGVRRKRSRRSPDSW